MNNKDIHYLWVGSPSNNSTLFPSHDVEGPIEMAKTLQKKAEKGIEQNRLFFWCLKEHQGYYLEQFKKHNVEIQVCSIENLLEKEIKGKELNEEAKFVQEYMADSLGRKKNTITDRVAVKDICSLFLLLSQGGYFFDTNVFPDEEHNLTLSGEEVAKTVDAGPHYEQKELHDYYIMYSPKRLDQGMKAVFNAWKVDPGLSNVDAFGFERQNKLGFLYEDELGVKKFSYKSYQDEAVDSSMLKNLKFLKGTELFDYLFKMEPSWLFEKCLNHIGNIDQRVAFPQKKCLVKCDLWTLEARSLTLDIMTLPFTNDDNYVAILSPYQPRRYHDIYYFNRITKRCIPLKRSIDGFNFFPHEEKKSLSASEKQRFQLIDKSPKDWHPKYIVNTNKTTLLHHAVFINDYERVKALIKHSARLDVKANYIVRPKDEIPKEIIEFTPLELANYMGNYINNKKITKLLSDASPAKDINSSRKSFNQKSIDSLGFLAKKPEIPKSGGENINHNPKPGRSSL